MGILLLVVGLLGLASGGLKLRGRVRETLGYSPLAVAEAVVGAITLTGSGIGLARARPLAWTLVAVTLVLTVLSTWAHARLVGRYVKKREESEALRLKAYLLDKEQSR